MLLNVISALAAPVFGVVGVALGVRLSASAERERWLTQMRVEACLELAKSARAFLWKGAVVGSTASDDTAGQREAVREEMFNLRLAMTRLRLLGPPQLREASVQMFAAYHRELFDSFMGERVPDDQAELVERARREMMGFLDRATAALGLSDQALAARRDLPSWLRPRA